MNLLYPATFASSVACARDNLDQIAGQFVQKYCGQTAAESFRSACQNLDYHTTNQLLNQTIAAISDIDSAMIALKMFSEKFPQLPGLHADIEHALTEQEKVKVLSRYSEQILEIINTRNEGV